MSMQTNEQIVSLAKYTVLAMGMISIVGAVFLALGTAAYKVGVAIDDAETYRHPLSFPEIAKEDKYREGRAVYEEV